MSVETGVLVETSSGDFQSNIGCIFSLAVNKDDSVITVFTGATLAIGTAVAQDSTKGSLVLQYLKDKSDSMTLCPLSQERPIVTGLGLICHGPEVFRLKAIGGQINVFGHITSNGEPAVTAIKATKTFTTPAVQLKEKPVDEMEPLPPTMMERSSHTQKRKLESDEMVDATEKLSKAQRRKLAKQKTKELEATVAALHQHTETKEHKDDTSHKKHVASMTKERRIKGGVLVRDFVIGTGPLVKAGRKLSVLYEGAFTDGKVFDRQKNKLNPLVFRQGTAQVVRGLEKGMEGMRVGGEQEITIPPELGYGEKGSGDVVPPNSTLVFSVQLVAMG